LQPSGVLRGNKANWCLDFREAPYDVRRSTEMRLYLLLFSIIISIGCAGKAKLLVPSGPGDIELVSVEPGGKGLFIVRPEPSSKNCKVTVITENGASHTDCKAEYLVGCDASVPAKQPFCWLIRELGPVRESIYPANRR
jgi:hypothetical protein